MERETKNNNKLISNLLIITILLFLSFGLGIYFILQKNNQSTKSHSGPLPPRQLDELKNYSTSEYVMPLENNAVGSIYSSRVQIRGRIQDIRTSQREFAVTSASKLLHVTIPGTVKVLCLPAEFTDAKGQKVLSKQVFLDFHLLQSNQSGKILDFSQVQEIFTVNSDITLIAGVTDKDQMTAQFLVGYDCKV